MSDDIERLTGRDLDIAVAERVMGVTPRDVRARGSTDCVRMWTSNKAFQDGMWEAVELQQYAGPPPYSTEIRAAMDVLYMARSRPVGNFMIRSFSGNVYRVAVWGARYGSATGATVSEAICRAALLAVAEEVP